MKLYCLSGEYGADELFYCDYINLDYVIRIEQFYDESKPRKYGLRFTMADRTQIETYFIDHRDLEEEIVNIEDLTSYPEKVRVDGAVTTYPS